MKKQEQQPKEQQQDLQKKAQEVYDKVKPILYCGLPIGVIRQICQQILNDIDSTPISLTKNDE